MVSSKTFACFSWNVRGLGDTQKCDKVLTELIDAKPHIVALQETKLSSLTPSKIRSFLPSHLDSSLYNASLRTTGGILTAWDSSQFTQISCLTRRYSNSVTLALVADGTQFCLTNVYATATAPEKPAFLAELQEIVPTPDVPWIIMGDFNLIRTAADKNNNNFNRAEAAGFNDAIDNIGQLEIPLTDWSYTWSNNRSHPTLVRLDRVFVNLA